MMQITDCKFPHIIYDPTKGPSYWGTQHGEEYRDEINELAQIRKDLMLQKNPSLKSFLDELALEQAQATQSYYPELYEEFEGIRNGSNLSLTDLIIVNNYTDFRDIALKDQGCTSVGIKSENTLSGQTWDMHSSAKNYVCTIELPGEYVVYSLVGCLGMMGANKSSIFIGVNNINTQKAKTGVIWPAIVRDVLSANNYDKAKKKLINSHPTSGHNYLISSGKEWENWEISPNFKVCSDQIGAQESEKRIFHTNHCLHPEAQKEEETISRNSTSFDRYQVMQSKINNISLEKELIDTLQGHDNYPKSICGHFQSGVQDPSITCGGGVFNHRTNSFHVWRGCVHEDKNYIDRVLTL